MAKQQRTQTLFDLRYLKAVDLIIERGLASDFKDFSLKIGFDESTISKMRSAGRGASVAQVEATISVFDLNANYFFRNENVLFMADLVQQKPSNNRSYGDTFSLGTNSPVIHGDNVGTVKAKYEQIAEQIYNQHAPPDLEDKIHTLVSLTRDIKKMNDGYESENNRLNDKVTSLEKELDRKNDQLLSIKDELLDFYRAKGRRKPKKNS